MGLNFKDVSFQRKFWASEFGNDYIDRNNSIEKINENYKRLTGITINEIYEKNFDDIDRKSVILELGCNIGLKLSILYKMGFRNLYGLEINKKAYRIAKENNPDINFINSSIENFETNDKKFDLVYTSGVLVHIHPSNLDMVIKKIINLSKKYIFGFENFSENLAEKKYRGQSNVLWKQNFPILFKKFLPTIRIIKQEKIPYKIENLCDITYLLEKVE